VRAVWRLTKRKKQELLRDQGRPPYITNMDIILARFPKARQEVVFTLLLGTYVELMGDDRVQEE
jgi:hypothetical protein